MRVAAKIAAAALVLACAASDGGAGAAQVSKAEGARWLRWLIPLPKQIAVERKVTLPAAQVGIRLRQGASEVEQTAAAELRALFKEKANVEPTGRGFEILLGVCDATGKLDDATVPDAARLTTLPNGEQAYLIRPLGENRLALAALDGRGVFYAAQTLRQLLEPSFADGKVTLPLAVVTDWPDLAERGEWGGSANNDIVWMARHKMNVVESHVSLGMTPEGRGTAKASQERIDLARRHALNYVPIITHLNGIGRTGVYDHYPELRGKGKSAQLAGHPSLVAPCCAQAKLADVLADWMDALASQPGVTDICGWLSECRQSCGCEECVKVGQWAFEARRFVEACRRTRKKHPKLGFRILLTQGSYTTNDKVLAEVPKGIGVSYYDGGRTYDSSREPMIYPLLEKFAADGGWLGCYPQLTASWRIVCPWSGPQFIRTRMNEFVDKKLQCLAGYATPNNKLYEFNIVAAAEWSWNAKGRDEREFATAWATRRGMKEPEAVAEWAVTLGPVGWDVYGSRIPAQNFFGRASGLVAGGGKPVLGEGMFRYFPSVEHMDRDLAACAKAMAIAKRLDVPLLLTETRVIEGFVRMVKEIYTIANRVATPKRPTYPERVELQKAMNGLSTAGLETCEALRAWERLIGVGLGGRRFFDSVDVTEKTVAGIGDALAPLGVSSPLNPYLRHEVSSWTADDFHPKPRITKVVEVTDQVLVAGTYHVGFQYTRGWRGLGSYRCALASAPADKPGQRTELSVDEHTGSTGARSKGNVYTLALAKRDPEARYFVVADVRGSSTRTAPANRKGCDGVVWIKAVLPGNWRELVAAARPLSDEEMARKNAVRFTGKGLRVGVVQGGYGSGSVLATLRKAKGIDAQPMAGLYAESLKGCQVVVLPQSRGGAAMGKDTVAAVEQFVRDGGGLITTHNAVGYRGLSLLLTDVCARGLAHVRDAQWLAVAEHPVTAGIELNKPLPHAYYDHIELEPGPKGLVVARASESKRPVVVCGEPGKGRYVACGMAIGLSPETKEAPPTGAEKALLENAVRWVGRLR